LPAVSVFDKAASWRRESLQYVAMNEDPLNEVGSPSDTDRSCHPEESVSHRVRVPLIKENLKFFDFESGAHITMVPSASTPTDGSSKARSTKSSTIWYNDKGYNNALQLRGCVFPSQEVPVNHEDIMKALKPIDMDKLSEADAWKIINGVQIAQNELNVQALILPLIMDAT
jgi:hypothetical protein